MGIRVLQHSYKRFAAVLYRHYACLLQGLLVLRHRSCAYVFVNVCSVAYHLILGLMHVP